MADITETYGTDIRHYKDFVRTNTGNLETISGLDNIKEAIFRRIMTTKGTIIHRPNYGCSLGNYQNAPASLANKRKIALEIQDQLIQDPRIKEVLGVSFDTTNKEPDKFILKVRIDLIGYGETEINFKPFGE
jgi:phage baseplate assembly protein W